MADNKFIHDNGCKEAVCVDAAACTIPARKKIAQDIYIGGVAIRHPIE